MSTNYHLVSDISDAQLEHYLTQKVIAVDSELHGLKLYRDQVCVVQVGDRAQNISLIRPEKGKTPNLKILMESPKVLKVFHFALTDVAFFKVDLEMAVAPFWCTKVMSKIARTYTGSHGLKHLTAELLGIEISKEQQQTDWASPKLSPAQLEYAANDVLHLVEIYEKLLNKIKQRPQLSTGATLIDLNEKAQAMLPGLIDLLIHGYGDQDMGWQTTLFQH